MRVRPPQNRKSPNRFFADSVIVHSSPDLSTLALATPCKPICMDLHHARRNRCGGIALLPVGIRVAFLQGHMSVETHLQARRRLAAQDLQSDRGTGRRRPWPRFRGVVPTSCYNTTDIKSFFDQCASTGSPEQHGPPQRLLEYRLALVRKLARPRPGDVVLDLGCGNGHHLLALGPEVFRGIGIDVSPLMIELARTCLRNSPWTTNLAFEVDDAEKLKGIADQSIDLAICIGAFEHMLDKRAVLGSIYRVLKFGGRFFCLTPNADYVWYRTMAPLLRFATKHLSSDRMLTREEFSVLLDQIGFRHIRSVPWTFIPKGDMPALVASLLSALDNRAICSIGFAPRRSRTMRLEGSERSSSNER